MSATGVLREIIASFGVEVDDAQLRRFDGTINGAIGQLRRFGSTLVGGGVVLGLRHFVNEMARAGEELDDTSQRLGINTQALQAWQLAAAINGSSAEELNQALAIFQRNSQGAVTGNQEMSRTFRRMGIDVRDSHGQIRDLDSLLPDVAEAFTRIENPTQRTATAMALFGRSGNRLLPFLSQGRAGLADMRAEMERLGGGATQEMIDRSADLRDEQDRLDFAWFSLRSRLANFLLPIFLRFTELTTSALAGFNRLTAGTHVLQIALVGLGVYLSIFAMQTIAAFAAPLATFAIFATAIGFLILFIDDLVTTFEGGHSVIRAFVDELFGVGTTADIVNRGLQNLRNTWDELTSGTLFQDFVRELHDIEQPGTVAHATTAGLSGAEAGEAQRRAAALRGEVVGRPGQSYEEALAEANAIRGSAGMLGVDGAPVGAGAALTPAALVPRTAAVPAPSGPAGASVDARTDVSITVAPGTSADQLQAIRQVVAGTLDERNRQAAAILGREAVE